MPEPQAHRDFVSAHRQPSYVPYCNVRVYLHVYPSHKTKYAACTVTALRAALLNEVNRASFAEDRILREKLRVRALSLDRDSKGGF